MATAGADHATRLHRKLLIGGRRVVVDAPPDLTAEALVRWLGGAWVGPDVKLADVSNGPLEPSAAAKHDGAWSLVVSAGPDFLRSHVLRPNEAIVVGRLLSGGETIAPGRWAIDDATVSVNHVEFRLRGGELDVRDLGSRNGTRVSHLELAGVVVCVGATTIVCRPMDDESADGLGAFDFDVSTGTWLTARTGVRRITAPVIDVPLARSGGRIGVRARPGAIPRPPAPARSPPP